MKQPHIEILKKYTPQDAAQIGRLMPYLSDKFTNDPIPEKDLRQIIESPYHDQLVIRDESGQIVGTATLSIVIGVASGIKAYLDEFVVDPESRGGGIGSKLWDGMLDWARLRKANQLNFTSSSAHASTHPFYLKRGAIIRDTNYFKKTL